jgi:site-specific DNA-methyltransferase (adenine-specific)
VSTEPYYQDDHATIYHGDCLELVDVWGGADVLVTDPPYGMSYVDRQGAKVLGDSNTAARDRALAEWGSKPALVFGTWKAERPVDIRQVLIWHKLEVGLQGDCSLPWANTHEEVYVMGGPWDAPRGGSVLPVKGYQSSGGGRPNHPTPKPPELMQRLLLKCPPGVVADPFMGSGSTLLAAKNLGRRAIGVEMDERYCEIAAKRLAQEVLPL